MAGSGGSGGTGGSAGSDAGKPGSGGGIGPSGPSFTPSGPIVLKSGQTITGLAITSTVGPCIQGNGVSNVRITNSKIGPCGPGVNGVGVGIEQSNNIRVDHNYFDDVASALYVASTTDGGVQFDHNRAERVRGPSPRGQMVQFNNVQGAGNKIFCNISDQTVPGYLDGPEDHISIFESGGLASSPIEIAYNRLRGGGPSTSGSGIMTGDYGSAYVYVHHNTMVETANVGFAIAGGHNITLDNNRAFSPQNAYSNVGAVIWAQAGQACTDNTITNNRTAWTSKSGEPKPFWDGGNCQNTTMSNNVWGDKTLDASIFDQAYTECD
jgi:hypothetical protein